MGLVLIASCLLLVVWQYNDISLTISVYQRSTDQSLIQKLQLSMFPFLIIASIGFVDKDNNCCEEVGRCFEGQMQTNAR